MNTEAKYLEKLLKHQEYWLILLTVIILLVPILTNFYLGKPVFSDQQSYYHLNRSSSLGLENLHYFPLFVFLKVLPLNLLPIITITMACLSLLLFYKLFRKGNFSKKLTLFILLFTILSPSFIHAFTNLTLSSYFLFLILLGFYLFLSANRFVQISSLIPFILITFLDLFSSILLIVTLLIYSPEVRKLNKKAVSLMVLVITFFVFNWIILKREFLIGSFYPNHHLTNLVSDLGAVSGVSFFILLLALVGLVVTWKKKNWYKVYFLLPVVVPVYFYDNRMMFLLSLIIHFFAAIGFVRIFQRSWILGNIRKYSIFLIILGLLFSTLSYLDRSASDGPFKEDEDTLIWIKNNTPQDTIIFSDPLNSYYIEFFSEKQSYYLLYEDQDYSEKRSQDIFSATYVNEYRRAVADSRISLFYITPQMRKELPAESGLLFLLKSENFKLVRSYHGFEVWAYME